ERVPSAHLREAGDAGLHLVATRLLGRVAAEILRQQRPRADEGHVAAQHVPELRQLVEARGTEEPSQRREPRLVRVDAELRRVGRTHRPELEEREAAAAETGPRLPEEER